MCVLLHAAVLSILIPLRRVNGIRREELLHGELHLTEDGAGVLLTAAGGTLFAGHAIVVGWDEQLTVPLQPDDGELAQGDIHPPALAPHIQLAGEAAGDAGGHLRSIAAGTCRRLTGVGQAHAQDDGVDGVCH